MTPEGPLWTCLLEAPEVLGGEHHLVVVQPTRRVSGREGFRVWGSGVKVTDQPENIHLVYGLRFGFWGLGFVVGGWGSGFWGLGFGVWGVGCEVGGRGAGCGV